MPLFNADGTPFDPATAPGAQRVQDTITPNEALELDDPTVGETVSAAFRQDNIVASYLTSKTTGMRPDAVEDGYNSWNDIKGTKYEPFFDRFTESYNSRYSNALKAQIDQEEKDKRTLAAAGAGGVVASVAAGVIDLPTLLPGAGIVRATKGGISVARSALAISAASVADATISEYALHQSQATRNEADSAIIIGFSAITGGLLGAGIAKAIGSVESKRLADLMADQSKQWFEEPSVDDIAAAYDRKLVAGGADVVAPKVDPSGIDYANKAQKIIAKGAVYNPMLQLLESQSNTSRSVVAQLPEMSFALKMTNTGESQPQAVETLVKEWTLGRVGLGIKTMEDNYKALKKSGDKMTRKEFRERVGRALRRGDRDEKGNDFISRSAQEWRNKLIDPLKDEAINAKLLPEDVRVTTAASYFTRVYNRSKIIARENEFKNIVKRWAYGITKETKEGATQFASKADFDQYIDEIADEVFNKLTGRATLGEAQFVKISNERGPLKERTFNIPDERIEDFLEDDVELVMRRYARIMSADVELTKKFGRADMRDQIQGVVDDYKSLRGKLDADKKLKPEEREKLRTRLTNEEAKDIRNIEGLRDRLRGTYLMDQKVSGFGRAAQAVQTFNYVRLLGGVTISSIPDIGRHIMVHGLGRFFGDGLAPLITNMKAVKMSVQEAKLAGSATELLNHSRMATWAEITDPYAYQSPFLAFLSNTGSVFSKANGMVYWNEFQKDFAAVMTQSRILRNAEKAARKGFDGLTKKEQQYMALLGVGRGDAEELGALFAKHGQKEGSVYIANTEKWVPEGAAMRKEYDAVRKFRAAVNKEVDTTIITKGIGDTPLLMDHPIASAILQFKSFMLASHQRMLLRATTDEMAGALSGLMTLVGVGMMTYMFKQLETGRELSDNPGKWVAEGIDRSGALAMFTEYNNIAEKLGFPGYYTALQGMFPNADQSAPASRYAQRNLVGSALGPSFGFASDLVTSTGAVNRFIGDTVKGEDAELSDSEVRTLKGLIPGQNLPIIKSILHYD